MIINISFNLFNDRWRSFVFQ